MNILSKLSGNAKQSLTEILTEENIESVDSKGNFSRIKTKNNGEIYFLTSEMEAIEENIDNYRVMYSNKHQCDFIVPKESGSSFSKKAWD